MVPLCARGPVSRRRRLSSILLVKPTVRLPPVCTAARATYCRRGGGRDGCAAPTAPAGEKFDESVGNYKRCPPFASCTNYPSAAFSLFPGGNEKRRKGQLHPPAMPAVSCLPRLPLSKKGRICPKIHKFLFLFFLNSLNMKHCNENCMKSN